MAKKKKNISVNVFDKAVKDQHNNTNTIEWNGLSIDVKYTLNLADAVSFVDAVTNGCFNDETGEYMSTAKPFAMRMAVISFYTNITMPQNYDKRYEMIYEDGLYESIVEAVNREQFSDLVETINDRIGYMIRIQIASHSRDINSLIDQFNRIVDAMSQLTGNMSQDDVRTVIDAMSKLDVDNGQLSQVMTDVIASRQTDVEEEEQ